MEFYSPDTRITEALDMSSSPASSLASSNGERFEDGSSRNKIPKAYTSFSEVYNEDRYKSSRRSYTNHSEYYCLPEPAARQFTVPQSKGIDHFSSSRRFTTGFSSVRGPSSVTLANKRIRKDSMESNDSRNTDPVAEPLYQNNFLGLFSKKSRLSYAEEALPPEQECSSMASSEDETVIERMKQKLYSSFSNLSIEKYRERHWFCKRCRRPTDQCKCMCTIS